MNNGDKPAFGHGVRSDVTFRQHEGLTKREYFAGLAMQGILAFGLHIDVGGMEKPGYVAEDAVATADALLEELDK